MEWAQFWTMSRLRLDDAEKQKWVDLFYEYDLSAAAFCREFGLPYSSFLSWKRTASTKRKSGENSEAEFVELVVQPPDRGAVPLSATAACPVAELQLGSGMLLRVFVPDTQRQ